jgi:UDPglucose 6-dehydrogenase
MIAVIGMGVVGKAQARMLAGRDLVTYDIAGGVPYPDNRIGRCEYAVICTGTPQSPDGSADLSHVLEAVARLPDGMPVLIRSTMTPGTTDRIAAGRAGLACHVPEFMHERPGGAWSETTDVPFLILGGTQEAREFFAPRIAEAHASKIHECAALTAELVKYVINTYFATRVTFVNEMAGICAALGADWEDVRQAWLMDPRITPEYTGMDGFGPGFGGRCWPKDLAALRAASSQAGHPASFLDAIAAANEQFRAG